MKRETERGARGRRGVGEGEREKSHLEINKGVEDKPPECAGALTRSCRGEFSYGFHFHTQWVIRLATAVVYCMRHYRYDRVYCAPYLTGGRLKETASELAWFPLPPFLPATLFICFGPHRYQDD